MKAPILASVLLLAGCATAPQEPMGLIRTDGQVIRGNAALEQQLQIDKSICVGQINQSAVQAPIISGGIISTAIMENQRQAQLTDVGFGCLAQRGYILVPESQAAEKLAELRKTAAQRKKLAE